MALPNIYHLRRVAPTASKPCMICYKSTSSVLITPDNRDFFYTCDNHLKDKGFATPIVDQAKEEEEKQRKKLELEKAIEEVKKEYEEKMKRRKERKEKSKDDKDKDKDKKGKEEKKKDKEDDTKEEKEKDDKIKALESKNAGDAKVAPEDEPRVFQLHKSIYQMRVTRIQNAAQAKKTAEKLKNPSTFPAVPSSLPK